MKFYLILLVVQLIHFRDTVQESNEKLPVSIYYESLCPDSIRFINRQLYPAYQKIGSSLEVDFVPYGKASHELVNGKWVFKCQHGRNECWGNKAQACGLAEGKTQDQNIDFVNCVMGRLNPASETAIKACAPKLDVPSETILDCTESEKGDELLAKYGDQTHAVDPIITFVPTIIFNGQFDSENQRLALRDFLTTACNQFKVKPEGCQ